MPYWNCGWLIYKPTILHLEQREGIKRASRVFSLGMSKKNSDASPWNNLRQLLWLGTPISCSAVFISYARDDSLYIREVQQLGNRCQEKIRQRLARVLTYKFL